MGDLLYLAARGKESMPLFGFTDVAGLANPYGVRSWITGFDKGAWMPDRTIAEPEGRDGGVVLASRDPIVTAGLTLRTAPPTDGDMDSWRRGWGEMLNVFAQRDLVLVFLADTAAATWEYMDLLNASVPQLLRGGIENWDLILHQSRDTGVEIQFDRQPGIRGPRLNAADNLAPNATLTRHAAGSTGPPFAYDRILGTATLVTDGPDHESESYMLEVLGATNQDAGVRATTAIGIATTDYKLWRVAFDAAFIGAIQSVKPRLEWSGGGADEVALTPIMDGAFHRYSAIFDSPAATTTVKPAALFRSVNAMRGRMYVRNLRLERVTVPPVVIRPPGLKAAAADALAMGAVQANGLQLGGAKIGNRAARTIDFDGATDYLKATGAGTAFPRPDLYGFTVTAAVNTDAIGGRQVIAALYGAATVWDFAITSTGKLELQLYQAGGAAHMTATGATTLQAGVDYEVAGTFDGTTVRVYLNGVQDATSATKTGTMTTTTEQLTVGARGTPGSYFNGRIRDVVYFARGLAAAEVASAYASRGYPFYVAQGLGAYGHWQLTDWGEPPFVVGVETVDGDPASTDGLVFAAYNPGDLPVPAEFYCYSTAAATNIVRVRLRKAGRRYRGERLLTRFMRDSRWVQAEAGTLGTDTLLVADSGLASPGSGNAALQINYATTTAYARRWRMVLPAQQPGRFRVLARFRGTLTNHHSEVYLAWSPDDVDPATVANDPVDLTFGQIGYLWADLGEIVVPDIGDASAYGLTITPTLELWARNATPGGGSGNLNVDGFALFPADELAGDTWTTLSVPQGRATRWDHTQLATIDPITGDPGFTAGADKADYLELNATNEGASTPPSAGLALAAGRHFFRFRYRQKSGGSTLRVVSQTDNSIDGGPVVTSGPRPSQDETVIAIDVAAADAGELYNAQQYHSTGGGETRVFWIEWVPQPVVTQNEKLVSLPEVPAAFYNVDIRGVLDQAGEPALRLDPGLNLVQLIVEDVAGGTDLEPQSLLVRDVLAGLDLAPRNRS